MCEKSISCPEIAKACLTYCASDVFTAAVLKAVLVVLMPRHPLLRGTYVLAAFANEPSWVSWFIYNLGLRPPKGNVVDLIASQDFLEKLPKRFRVITDSADPI